MGYRSNCCCTKPAASNQTCAHVYHRYEHNIDMIATAFHQVIFRFGHNEPADRCFHKDQAAYGLIVKLKFEHARK